MPTKIPVMSICDFGLMKLGRFADFRAQLKMREILLVLTSSEPYIRANPKLTCKFDGGILARKLCAGCKKGSDTFVSSLPV